MRWVGAQAATLMLTPPAAALLNLLSVTLN